METKQEKARRDIKDLRDLGDHQEPRNLQESAGLQESTGLEESDVLQESTGLQESDVRQESDSPQEPPAHQKAPAPSSAPPKEASEDFTRRLLSGLQLELEELYQVKGPLPVSECLLERIQWESLSDSEAPEELVVLEGEGGLELGLWLDEEVSSTLQQRGPLTTRRLEAHCQAVEGVSHFLYLSHRATLPRPVSLLELELQAEIDKFSSLLLRFWRRGKPEVAAELIEEIFENVSYRPALNREQRERYSRANRLARLYCRFLHRQYVQPNLQPASMEGFLADLRRMYRLGAAEKLSHAAQGAPL